MLNNVHLRWSLAMLALVGAVVIGRWSLAQTPAAPGSAPAYYPPPAPDNTLPPPPPDAPATRLPAPVRGESVPADAPPMRRRQAVLTLPRGIFVKAFEVEPFCKGRLIWNYEDDQVQGTIELESDIAGVSAELAIESEIALSSSGVVFGVITGVKLTDLKVNPQMLAAVAEKFPLKVGPKFYPLIEPLVNEALVDTPFSYQCRVRGDRMTISHVHIGPCGPLVKYTLGMAPQMAMIQAPAIALEGTYQRVTERNPLIPTKREVPPAFAPKAIKSPPVPAS
jgi:hypothetical protein